MTDLLPIFLTGVTTGGLSCLAVQGGLLASSVVRQAEQDVQHDLSTVRNRTRSREYETKLANLQRRSLPEQQMAKAIRNLQKRYREVAAAAEVAAASPGSEKRHSALPIVVFLTAKVGAYTVLGLLLGWLGSMLQLTPLMKGILQIAIAVFMLGTAARMLELHPVFRYFVIQPPRFITRFIRRRAKAGNGDFLTPFFLGGLTVFIPCGITQAMMALAIGSGNPLSGAAIMASFTLGTTPLFFALAYMATRLGAALQRNFFKVAAVAVAGLALVSLEGGLNLVGSPISFSSMVQSIGAAASGAGGGSDVASGPPTSTPTLQVENAAYTPSHLLAKAGLPVKLSLVTNGTTGCTRTFVIPSLGVQRALPQSGTTELDLPAQAAGSTVRFTCSMGMYNGQIDFS